VAVAAKDMVNLLYRASTQYVTHATRVCPVVHTLRRSVLNGNHPRDPRDDRCVDRSISYAQRSAFGVHLERCVTSRGVLRPLSQSRQQRSNSAATLQLAFSFLVKASSIAIPLRHDRSLLT
jgi:hypothetical protein